MPDIAPNSPPQTARLDRLRDLPDRLQQLRSGRGWTQQSLATRVRIRPDRLSRIENGRCLPSIEELVRLSAIFEVSLDELALGGRLKKVHQTSFLARDLATVADLTEPEELLAVSKVFDLLAALLRQCRSPRKTP